MQEMLSAEVLFHRYCVEQAERHPDARRYRGRQDLSQLEPALQSLLPQLRDAYNQGLLRQHGLAGDGINPRYYFDYVDSDVVNALAFEYEGIGFIGITIPLIRTLWFVCEDLSITPEIAMRFSAATLEQRQMLQVEIFNTVLGFVVNHEYGITF